MRKQKIRFLKAQKYAIHPARGPIVFHDVGDEEVYPVEFCQDMIEAGAAELIDQNDFVDKIIKSSEDDDEARESLLNHAKEKDIYIHHKTSLKKIIKKLRKNRTDQ